LEKGSFKGSPFLLRELANCHTMSRQDYKYIAPEKQRELPKEFNRAGLHWKQTRRNANYAIYEGCPISGRFSSTPIEWEVIKVMQRRAVNIKGKPPGAAGEGYPSPNEWGTYGVTFADKDLAISVYHTVSTDPEPSGLWTYTDKLRKGLRKTYTPKNQPPTPAWAR